MDALEALTRVGVALAIGLMLGAERERNHPGAVPGGVRTFALLAIGGCVSEAVSPLLAAAGLLFVGAMVVASYVRTSRIDKGTTSEVAAVVAYALGALAWERPELAVLVAVLVAVILASKQRIHHFVRDVVSDEELEDALKLFVVAFVILPLLPAGASGPYGVLDARRIWTVVTALTAINFAGYVATRLLGAGRGLAVTGLAGGFMSAAATTGAMALRAKNGAVRGAALAAAVLASVSTLVQLAVMTAIVSPTLLRALAPAIVLGGAALVTAAWVASRAVVESTESTAADTVEPAHARAFALRPALVLAGLLTAATLLARWGVDVFGSSGTVAAAGVAGFADAHAGALAAATLLRDNTVDLTTAVWATAVALATNTVVKVVLAFLAGGRSVGARYTALMALPVLVIATTLVATALVRG